MIFFNLIIFCVHFISNVEAYDDVPPDFHPTELIQKECNLGPWLPSPHPGTEITVFYITDRFRGISDIDESFSVFGAFSFIYKIPKLGQLYNSEKWPKSIKNLTNENSFNYWVPGIIHRNSFDNVAIFGDSASREVFTIWLDHSSPFMNTSIWRTYYGSLMSTCDLNFFKFPFDHQICTIDFFSYNSDALYKITYAAAIQQKLDKFMPENSVWEFVKATAETYFEEFGSETTYFANYSGARFYFTFQRKSHYYIVNLFIPSQILGFLLLSTFFLPASSSDRSAFSCTVMLAIFVLQGQILSQMPLSPKPIIAAYYSLSQVCFGLMITVYSAIICWFIDTKPNMANRLVKCGKCAKHPMSRVIDKTMFIICLISLALISAASMLLIVTD